MTPAPPPLSPASRLTRHPDVVLREEGDGAALLYDPRSGAVRLLNPTAVSIWKLLDGTRSLAQVVEDLRRDYQGVDEQAPEQVLSLARELCRSGAAVPAEGA